MGKQYVDIRSYEAQNHIDRKATVRIVVGNEFMDIPYTKLKKKTIITPEPIQSKFNPNQKYYLWSYEWLPTGKVAEEKNKEIKIY